MIKQYAINIDEVDGINQLNIFNDCISTERKKKL